MEKRTAIPDIASTILSLFLTVAISLGLPMHTQAEEAELELYAKAAVLMDADSGRVLYERRGDEQLPMASTTKIMTLIVTLENADLEEAVTVSSYAASMPKVHLGMKSGEQYRLKDLLFSLMLESHNDSAVAVAEHVGGSVEQFAALMNEKAAAIGCENTYYITPNGLDATQGERFHSTTAKDLARVMSYCITGSPQKDAFLEITGTQSYSFKDLSGKRSFSCTNHNAFLNMMTGALSGKTGFTGKAGYCYVGALRRDGRTFVVALLACGWPNHKTYKWSDTRALMEYGLCNYSYRSFGDIAVPDESMEKILVHDAQGGAIGENVYLEIEARDGSSQGGILMREDEKVTVTLHKVKTLSAPVKAGQEIGHISYMVGSEEWKRISLVASGDIEAVDLGWCVRQVAGKWMLD